MKMLDDNPNVSIELAAHTDYKGKDQYNLRLSERRAQSVVDYLIKAGIDPRRLQPKGYGESQPKVITKKLATQYPQSRRATCSPRSTSPNSRPKTRRLPTR